MTTTETILSAIPGNPLQGLRQADRLWHQLRHRTLPSPTVITPSSDPLAAIDWDVVIGGGTLGIFIGAALAQRGFRVALIERGPLRGRAQEWNISRRELDVFHRLDLLTAAELAQIIASEYNPARIAFFKGIELWVEDVLNIGVDPILLLDLLKTKFLAAGGILLEHTRFVNATVHDNGIQCHLSQDDTPTDLTTRLLIDSMGHFSPIARQARSSESPDAICLVVGTCGTGFPLNDTGDLLRSITPIQNQCQYFWEAFPARDGRTTYLFTYLDAHPDRPSLERLFDDYFRLLPGYQQIELEAITWKRALFGVFPCYRRSPLQSPWSRILHVGDGSGSQSPLSFGGFGAMLRHLSRLTDGIQTLLQADDLTQSSLALLQPYQPNLAVTWLFQRTMSVGINQTLPPDHINQLLSAVFTAMEQCGDPVLKPFLQDVVQFSPLSQTLLRTTLANPSLIAQLIPQLGLPALLSWMGHYLGLGSYRLLDQISPTLTSIVQTLAPSQKAYYQQWLAAWHYGSGADFHTY